MSFSSLTTEQKIYNTLRIASAMCFIGHGAFGIITKPVWCNYFAVFGIGHDMAYRMMPIVGSLDILMGLSLLIYPIPIIAGWLVFWGIVTALLRPLSGEPLAEFIERAGNFGAPLALLLIGTRESYKDLFRLFKLDKTFKPVTYSNLISCLKVCVFLLLLGHGWLNLIEKKALVNQYASLGFLAPNTVAQIVGLFEIVAAFIILIKPFRALIIGLFIWKMSTELFYPHHEIFEFIERGGSYGVILALWLTLERSQLKKQVFAYQIM